MTRFNIVSLGLIAIALISAVHAQASGYGVRSPAADRKEWSGALSASGSRNLVDLGDGSRTDAASSDLSLRYLSPVGSFSAALGYSYGLNRTAVEGNVTDWSDSFLSYSNFSQKWRFLNDFDLTLTPTAKIILPLSHESKDIDRLQTATILSVIYGLTPNKKVTSRSVNQVNQTQSIANRFTYTFGFSIGRNFHQFEETLDGEVLNKYSSNQSLGINYSFNSLDISIDYSHKSRWSYQNQTRESYGVSEEISYTFLKSWNVIAGHTNSGAALKPNGQDSNFSVYDEKQSIVYFTAAYLL